MIAAVAVAVALLDIAELAIVMYAAFAMSGQQQMTMRQKKTAAGLMGEVGFATGIGMVGPVQVEGLSGRSCTYSAAGDSVW